MISTLLFLIAALGGASPSAPDDFLKDQLAALASPELKGRGTGTPGGQAATEQVARAFAAVGLEPLGDEPGSYFQRIPGEGEIPSRNVIGRVFGTGESGEVVLVTAHVDHLGERGGVVFPGANTNASGVAVLLGMARRFAAKPAQRDLVFAVLDAEEIARRGSSHLLRYSPVPAKRIVAITSLESLGHGYLGVLPDHVFALGAESDPNLGAGVEIAGADLPLKVLRLGRDLMGPPAATEPFLRLGVPYLVLTGGPHPDSHTPHDRADQIDIEHLRAVAELAERLIRGLADHADRWEGEAASTPASTTDGKPTSPTSRSRAETAWKLERAELGRLRSALQEAQDGSLSVPLRGRISGLIDDLETIVREDGVSREGRLDALRELLRTGRRLPGGGN